MEVEGDNNNNNETTADDDPKVLWEKCEESQRKRMKLMEEEKENLQKEIDTMNSVVATAANISDDDIIEIDAGGTIIKVLRSTLTLAHGTMFSHMFSGRWEESLKRDKNGRVFLNHDPELIEIIVNYLRMKAIEDPNDPLTFPDVPTLKKKFFDRLLRYFGLMEFFNPTPDFLPLDIDNMVVVQSSSSVGVTHGENKIHVNRNGPQQVYFLACKPSIDSSGEGSFWKVTIDAVSNKGDGLLLGIIGNLNADNSSYGDSTCCGWASDHSVYDNNTVIINGKHQQGHGGWIGGGFTQGECFYFHLKSNKLTMFCVKKNQKFTIDVAATVGTYCIHFNMYYSGTKITLEPLNEEERGSLV